MEVVSANFMTKMEPLGSLSRSQAILKLDDERRSKMADPRIPDPRTHVDASHPDGPRVMPQAPYNDPAADPRIANQTIVQPRRGNGGLIAAGIIAVLLVVALIAFSSGPATDPGTTAVIPPAEEMAPAPEAAPMAPAAPLEEAPAAPVTPIEPAPAQ